MMRTIMNNMLSSIGNGALANELFLWGLLSRLSCVEYILV